MIVFNILLSFTNLAQQIYGSQELSIYIIKLMYSYLILSFRRDSLRKKKKNIFLLFFSLATRVKTVNIFLYVNGVFL